MNARANESDLAPGTRLGSYEIKKKLGAGGMGSVYLANDVELRRPVALKVLRLEKLGQDDDARRRLLREAQAASQLNHPDIVTVYQIGSEAGVDFIAMEYVTGRSLQAYIPSAGLAVRAALEIAIQVADALAAAHEAGVVHRDLTPGNIMITDRGRAKVVDFGLAARTAAAGDAKEGQTAETQTLTEHKLVGTSAYMAPEQILGGKVDGRTDIWALGCVLYRMLTGRNAFAEETGAHTMAAVLTKDAPSLAETAPSVPAGVDRAVARCLRKKVEERWQSVADLRFVLEGLLDSPDPAPRKTGRRLGWAGALLAGGLLGGAGMWLATRPPRPAGGHTVFRMATVDSSLTTAPSLSRDGALLAYASDRSGEANLDIWLQQVDGRQPIRLTNDPADDTDPSMSPDGTKIAFRSERGGGGVYEVPALGGQASLIAAGGRNPKFSPDGRWIAYWTGRDAGYLPGSAKVWVVEAGGGAPRDIGRELASAAHAVWSPDGSELLVLARGPGDLKQTAVEWWVVPLGSGTPLSTGALAAMREQGLLTRQMIDPRPLAWAGGRVMFALRAGDAVSLWQAPFSGRGRSFGPVERVTTGPGHQTGASLAESTTGPRLAFSEILQTNAIWTLPVEVESGAPRGAFARLTNGGGADSSPSLSGDSGKLTWIRRAANSWTIELRDLAGGKESVLLRSDRFVANAVISGDGASVFYSTVTGEIFRVPASGGAADSLCAECGTVMGASFDGRRVLYEPRRDEDLTALDCGTKTSLKLALRRPGLSVLSGGRYSPDARWVAFHEIDNQTSTTRVWIAPADGGGPAPRESWTAVTDGASVERDPAWSPEGRVLYYLSDRDGFRCIWARRLDEHKRPAGEPFAVQHFHAARWSLGEVRGHQIGLWAAPGRLVFALREETGNIWIQEAVAAVR
jgi:serine/threonine protein kinase/dipeptidyl aminopeptidase/acylaminoacyl peptidase